MASAAKRKTDTAEIEISNSEQLSLRLWLQLMKCTKTMEAGVGGHLRRVHNQSLARFDVLSQLFRFGDRWATVGEIAERLMASGGNITGLLDRMAAEDLLVRRASPDDRRSHQLRMTAKGRTLFREMTDEHARWVDAALDGVTDADKERLIGLLAKVRRTFADTAARNAIQTDRRE